MSSVYEEVVATYPDVTIHEPRVFKCKSHSQYSEMQWEAESILLREVGIEISFIGVTSNPPREEIDCDDVMWEWRDSKRDSGRGCYSGYRLIKDPDPRSGLYQCNPFKDLNKKHISQMYMEMGLIESLYPLTYSCEGYPEWNDNYQKHCGRCWWCKEREWGFGKL
jgi:hypothetical protein